MTIKKLGNPHSTYDEIANVLKDIIRGIFEVMGNSNFWHMTHFFHNSKTEINGCVIEVDGKNSMMLLLTEKYCKWKWPYSVLLKT